MRSSRAKQEETNPFAANPFDEDFEEKPAAKSSKQQPAPTKHQRNQSNDQAANPFASPTASPAAEPSIADFYSQMAADPEPSFGQSNNQSSLQASSFYNLDPLPEPAISTSKDTNQSSNQTLTPSLGPSTSQLNTSLSQSTALFRIERETGWRPSKEHGQIVSLAAANNMLVIGTSTNYIIRFNVDPSVNQSSKRPQLDAILLSKRIDQPINQVFLDPTGSHVLVSTGGATGTTATSYYLHSTWSKAHTAHKLKGVHVESVAWNVLHGNDKNSGKILLGTHNSLIYEMVLDEKNKESSINQLFDLNEGDAGLIGNAGPIHGLSLEMFPLPEEQASANQAIKWLVIAATPNRQYQFIGGPKLKDVFEGYSTQPRFQELPGHINRSELRFYTKRSINQLTNQLNNQLDEPPSICAWLTGAGIYYGELQWNSDDVIDGGKLLAYPEEESNDPSISPSSSQLTSQPVPPISLIVTEFHFLLLTQHELIAINQLSEEIVHEQSLDAKAMGEPRGLSFDAINQTIWLYTTRGIYEVIVEGEDREVWRLYLNEGDYEQALEYCDTPEQREIVSLEHARWLIDAGQYRLAAEKLATTRKSFEEVALEFVRLAQASKLATSHHAADTADPSNNQTNTQSQLEARIALKIYLLGKLRSLPPSALTQQTMICTWLTEIFLDNLNNLSDQSQSFDQSINQSNNQSFQPFTPFSSDSTVAALKSDDPYAVLSNDERAECFDAEKSEFHAFLSEWSDCLNKQLTINLLSSHGRLEDWLEFAADDLEWVMSYHIQCQQFDEAIECLLNYQSSNQVATPASNPNQLIDCLVKFAPVLIHERPRATVDCLIAIKNVDPSKLIPALMRYDSEQNASINQTNHTLNAESTRYLEHCVYKQRNRDPIVHNYLLSLYAMHGDSVPLLRYLDAQRSLPRPVFDAQYALRLCYEHSAKQACVAIYSLMGLHEQAVTLAITFDLSLAKRVIQQSLEQQTVDAMTAKRLWLCVAREILVRHVDDLPAAMALLADCGALALEDLLPDFPDTLKIGELKSEIARSLAGYSHEIDQLKASMDASTTAASEIRQEFSALQSRANVVSVSRKCDLCSQSVWSSPFFLFPSCGHIMHAHCAKQDIVEYWERHPALKKKVITERVTLEKEKQAQQQALKQAKQSLHTVHAKQAVANNPATNNPATNQSNNPSNMTQSIDTLFASAQLMNQSNNQSTSQTEWWSLSKAGKEQRILDDFASSECCLCGSMAIDKVQQPYIAYQEDQEQKLIQLWSI